MAVGGQVVHHPVPDAASGSYMVSASDLALSGTPDQFSAGLMLAPLQRGAPAVWASAKRPPSVKSGLSSCSCCAGTSSWRTSSVFRLGVSASDALAIRAANKAVNTVFILSSGGWMMAGAYRTAPVFFQNMVFSLLEVSGMGWITSQCSIILPSLTRNKSTMARPKSSGFSLE